MNKGNLITQLINTIGDSSTPLWFPELTGELVNIGEKIIKDDFGLTLPEYGTNRLWFKNKNTPRIIIDTIPNAFFDKPFTQIEVLDRKIICNYEKAQIEFYDKSEIVNSPVIECIAQAINLIKLVPSLLTTVFSLARCMHLIKLENTDFDVSFSEPHLPFSIFVSVPNKRVETDYIRVAEAIIHESMHLQLTLIENVIPLVVSSSKTYYSPWKAEYRTVGGVLHALYVFQVLNSFFYELLNHNSFSLKEKRYLIERKDLISKQVLEIEDFVNCPDLTNLGKDFTKRLIKGN